MKSDAYLQHAKALSRNVRAAGVNPGLGISPLMGSKLQVHLALCHAGLTSRPRLVFAPSRLCGSPNLPPFIRIHL